MAAPDSSSPILIFGTDHSGTTILYRMLAYHPRLVWLSQFTLRGGQVPGRSRRPGAGRLEPIAHSIIRPIAPHPWGKAELGQLRRLVVPRPGEEGQVWDHLLGDPRTAVDRLRESLTAFSERLRRRRVLAKRPGFYRHLEVLHEAFPGARFVHIVRDGRPVALSLRAKGLATGYIHQRASGGRPLDPGDALRAGARHWVDVLDRVARCPPIELLEVRYEDLCRDVHGVLRSALRHAELDDEAFPYSRCPRTLANRNDPWLRAATSDELTEIYEIEQAFLARYGYSHEPRTGAGSHAAPVSIGAGD